MGLMLTLLLYVVGAVLLYIAYTSVYQFFYWKIRKVPHVEATPILGSSGPLIRRKLSFADYILNLYKEFPEARYFGIFDFTKPAVIIKDPEIIREICIKSFENFMDHDAFITEEMDPMAGRNIFSLKGQRWKEVRATLSPSYTASRMKLLFELIAECSNEFVQHFIEHPKIAEKVDVKKAFTRYASDVIATAAFGIKVNSMKNPNNEFFANGHAAIYFNTLQFIKFILLTFFPSIMRFFGATFMPKAADTFFKNVIKDTVKMRQQKGNIRPDMIQLLVDAMNKNDSIKVTMDDIIGQSFIFFLAGFDTSSSLMAFVTLELAANPDIQQKLYEEIKKHLPDDDDNITYESVAELKYLDMVLKESLRMYPPFAMTNRVCTKDFKCPSAMEGCPECIIKKGTIIMLPVIGLHRDPKYYNEPEKFLPERFSDANKGDINPQTYLPFGLGPRQCIANRFALLETKIIIVNILRKFVIKFTKDTEYPIVFGTETFTTNAAGGVLLKFEQRKKRRLIVNICK